MKIDPLQLFGDEGVVEPLQQVVRHVEPLQVVLRVQQPVQLLQPVVVQSEGLQERKSGQVLLVNNICMSKPSAPPMTTCFHLWNCMASQVIASIGETLIISVTLFALAFVGLLVLEP